MGDNAGSVPLRQLLAADLTANTGRAGLRAGIAASIFDSSFFTLFFYRCAAHLYHRGYRRLGKLLWRFNIISSACHINLEAKIEPGLILPHPTGIVIGYGVHVERHVAIYQHVTIGRGLRDEKYPHIGEGVIIYPNAVIVGGLRVGARAVIGAGAVVIRDIPANAVVAGNPAKVIRIEGASSDAQ